MYLPGSVPCKSEVSLLFVRTLERRPWPGALGSRLCFRHSLNTQEHNSDGGSASKVFGVKQQTRRNSGHGKPFPTCVQSTSAKGGKVLDFRGVHTNVANGVCPSKTGSSGDAITDGVAEYLRGVSRAADNTLVFVRHRLQNIQTRAAKDVESDLLGHHHLHGGDDGLNRFRMQWFRACADGVLKQKRGRAPRIP